MRTLRTISELRAALAQHHREAARIGLVPTMGAFHAGHLSLMQRAREDCDVVVVSLFVNPAQFNDSGDLAAYPRDEGTDALLAADAGADFLFAPQTAEIYPEGFATTVRVSGVTAGLEGAYRGREHFDGVATVVTKLLNIVGPNIAYFGQKDAQQIMVIRRLVHDLDLQVEVEACPTVREPDGLAMSSRNVRLSAFQRQQAVALSRALDLAAQQVLAGETDADAVTVAAMRELEAAGVSTEYFQIVNSETFAPIMKIEGPALALVAARVGSTRLIDNHQLSTVIRPAALAGVNAAGSN